MIKVVSAEIRRAIARRASLGPTLLCAASIRAAQSHGSSGEISAPSMAYANFRLLNTDPPFELTAVKSLIGKYRLDRLREQLPSTAEFNRLSVPTRFTYTMLVCEDYAQICSGMPIFQGEENFIFAYPPLMDMTGNVWSHRQSAFLKANRHEVVNLIQQTIRIRRKAGLNLKSAIELIGAYELIPDLAKVFAADMRDHDVLTVIMRLMVDGHYGPFLQSKVYKTLYGGFGVNHKSFVFANESNKSTIVNLALGYYHSRTQK
jgi:hypothetical protein